MKSPENIPPSKKQLDFCYGILARIKECESDEYGQPLFEKSMANADRFIKKHRIPRIVCQRYRKEISDRSSNCPAGDWGGIPNA